jgi:hypothetical protein
VEEDMYRDPFTDEWKSRNQMVWLIKKGDLVLSNEPKQASTEFCRRIGVNDPFEFISSLVIYNGDNTPQSFADIPYGKRILE